MSLFTWRGARLLALAGICVLTFSRSSLAACGAASCFLVTGSHEGLAGSGRLQLDLSWRWLEQDRLRDGSHSTTEVLTPHVDFENGTVEPMAHEELRTLSSEARLDLGYGLSERLTLTAALPLLLDRLHEHREAGAEHHSGGAHATLGHGPGEEDEPGIESITTSGLGDIELGLRYGLIVANDDELLVGASLKLPTGPYDLRDGSGSIVEPGLQPGTGGWGGIGSLYWSHTLISHHLDLFVGATVKFEGENDLDYRSATMVTGQIGLDRKVSSRLRASLQLGVRHYGRDQFQGEDLPSTGFTELRLSPGLRFVDGGGSGAYAFVQLPIWQEVNEQQLAPGTSLMIGVSRAF